MDALAELFVLHKFSSVLRSQMDAAVKENSLHSAGESDGEGTGKQFFRTPVPFRSAACTALFTRLDLIEQSGPGVHAALRSTAETGRRPRVLDSATVQRLTTTVDLMWAIDPSKLADQVEDEESTSGLRYSERFDPDEAKWNARSLDARIDALDSTASTGGGDTVVHQGAESAVDDEEGDPGVYGAQVGETFNEGRKRVRSSASGACGDATRVCLHCGTFSDVLSARMCVSIRTDLRAEKKRVRRNIAGARPSLIWRRR